MAQIPPPQGLLVAEVSERLGPAQQEKDILLICSDQEAISAEADSAYNES